MAADREPWRALPEDAVVAGWRAPDGLTLRRFEWAASRGVERRGALLFAGGRGDFIEKYLEAYDHWHRAGWDVTAFDWRGQGLSRAGEREPAPDFAAMVRDLEQLVDDWRASREGPFVAVAHSMGGHLLLRALVESRVKIDAAVLVAPMIAVNAAPLPRRLAPLITSLFCSIGLSARPVWAARGQPPVAGSRRQSFLTASRERYEDELWWWRRSPGLRMGAPSWGWMREAYRSATSSFAPARLKRVGTPLLLLAAQRDRLVELDAIRRAAYLLPRARVIIFPDAAHEILRDADPVRDEALAAIDRFFEETAA